MDGIASVIGMLLLFGFFAVAVAMLPVSLYRIVVSLRRREPTGGHAGWLAFSLITLAVYGLVLYPVFMSARISAQDMACVDNMKALGLGMLQYEQDNDENFPPKERWGDAIAPYVKPRDDYQSKAPADIWRCPSSSSPFGYDFNSNLPRVEDELNAPTDIVMLFESDVQSRNVSGGPSALTPKPRHFGHRNFTFADGHTRSVGQWNPAVNWVNKPISP